MYSVLTSCHARTDEPTNHLDLSAIRWLSDLILEQRKLTVLVVTHDRAFLDEVCNRIIELDDGSLYTYEGNYADYLEGKEARLALQDAAVSAARAKYRVELDWMRRQPQVRYYLYCIGLSDGHNCAYGSCIR